MLRYTVVGALLAVATPSQAGEIHPGAAESIRLGSIRGVAYFTQVNGDFRVVTTLADGETGLPVRFEVTLADRQSLTISVPGKVGETGQELEISRVAGKLAISSLVPAADGLVVVNSQNGGD